MATPKTPPREWYPSPTPPHEPSIKNSRIRLCSQCNKELQFINCGGKLLKLECWETWANSVSLHGILNIMFIIMRKYSNPKSQLWQTLTQFLFSPLPLSMVFSGRFSDFMSVFFLFPAANLTTPVSYILVFHAAHLYVQNICLTRLFRCNTTATWRECMCSFNSNECWKRCDLNSFTKRRWMVPSQHQ